MKIDNVGSEIIVEKLNFLKKLPNTVLNNLEIFYLNLKWFRANKFWTEFPSIW